jgi:hypothetical protein
MTNTPITREQIEQIEHAAHAGLDVMTGDQLLALIALAKQALPRPIADAPTDGTVYYVYAAPAHGLPGFWTTCGYHPDAGWCVDEFREVTHFIPRPKVTP